MKIGSVFAASLAPLVDLIYPPRCPLCGDAIASQTGLCTACWSALEMLPAINDDRLAATVYNDVSRDLVLALKRGRKLALAQIMARIMAARLGPFEKGCILVPVPLHRMRLWQRGFNQSALLARELCRVTGHGLMLDGLTRRKATRSLGGLSAHERRTELAGAISITARRRSALAGASVLLVDDVLTSGATSSACTAALKSAGAARVRLACFAQTNISH